MFFIILYKPYLELIYNIKHTTKFSVIITLKMYYYIYLIIIL